MADDVFLLTGPPTRRFPSFSRMPGKQYLQAGQCFRLYPSPMEKFDLSPLNNAARDPVVV